MISSARFWPKVDKIYGDAELEVFPGADKVETAILGLIIAMVTEYKQFMHFF